MSASHVPYSCLRLIPQITKSEGLFLPWGGPTPQSPKVLGLRQRYISRMKETVMSVLITSRKSDFTYEELYGKAMAFPLVTADDLEQLLRALEPAIEIQLNGIRRKRPVLFKNDRVVVINPKALQ